MNPENYQRAYRGSASPRYLTCYVCLATDESVAQRGKLPLCKRCAPAVAAPKPPRSQRCIHCGDAANPGSDYCGPCLNQDAEAVDPPPCERHDPAYYMEDGFAVLTCRRCKAKIV